MGKIVNIGLHQDLIESLAGHLFSAYSRDPHSLNRIAVVSGGKRPALFLRRALAGRIKQPFIPFRCFSSDDFIAFINRRSEDSADISELDACHLLYSLAQRDVPELLADRGSFDRFLPWAQQILKFIEQLDLEDVSAHALENIQVKAGIGYDIPQSINELLRSIVRLRTAFHERLSAERLLSRGLSYLRAGSLIETADLEEFDEVVFAGFFFLHRTEANILRALHARKKASFFFQGDPGQWPVLAESLRSAGVDPAASPEVKPLPRPRLWAGFDMHSQVCCARQIVGGIRQHDHTVVVMPKPETLIPLISELSGEVEECNVSLGYPFRRSSLYVLLEAVFRAQETRTQDGYYARDLLAVLRHPLVKNLDLLGDPAVMRILVHKMEELLAGTIPSDLSSSSFVSFEDLCGCEELLSAVMQTASWSPGGVSQERLTECIRRVGDIFFSSWEKMGDFSGFAVSLENLLQTLVSSSPLSRYPLNRQMAQSLYRIKDQFQRSRFSSEPFSPGQIAQIFLSTVERASVSFSGSPLEGLQVLGTLETRGLTFKHVVVLDANETVLPDLHLYEPLIPREVLISLGLKRLEHEEQIQRYHFQRLISGAQSVDLVYEKRDDKERSRFVEEIIWAEQKKDPEAPEPKVNQAAFQVQVMSAQPSARKDPSVVAFLRDFRFSASSLNTYLACPLRFYYRYVLGLKESLDQPEEVEHAEIGTFVHELLYRAYFPLAGKKFEVDGKFTSFFLKMLDEQFESRFARRKLPDSFLIREIIQYRMQAFLDHEKMRPVRSVLGVEIPVSLKVKGASASFSAKAVIDRIDILQDESLLIVDYKTGSDDTVASSDADMIESCGFARGALKKTIGSFQLPLYLYCAKQQPQFSGRLANCCLYMVQRCREKDALVHLFEDSLSQDQRSRIMELYLRCMESLFLEIIDPGIEFSGDDSDRHYCGLCPFARICGLA